MCNHLTLPCVLDRITRIGTMSEQRVASNNAQASVASVLLRFT
jgi:hypothetical protein